MVITPLHLAAFEGRHAELKSLIQAGADVTAVDAQQRTALHHAVVGGHVSVVRTLLQAGASPLAPDRDGVTPEELARHCRFQHITHLLMEARGVRPPPLHFRDVMPRSAPPKGPSAPSI